MKKKALVPVLVLAILALLTYKLTEVTAEGVVLQKAVTGIKDDTSHTILVNRPIDNGSWIIVKDSDYNFFSKQDRNVFITKAMEDEMRKKYSAVRYIVSLRLETGDLINGIAKGEASAYFVSREDFNRMKIGDRVKIKISRFAKLTISLIEKERIFPKVGTTYFSDLKLINNTASFYIETYKPLTKEQIEILRRCGVRELSSSEVKTIYYGLIEESEVKRVENLSFVKDVYSPKVK